MRPAPARISVRELNRQLPSVVRSAEVHGHPVIITRHGKPVAFLIAFDSETGRDIAIGLTDDIDEAESDADADRFVPLEDA